MDNQPHLSLDENKHLQKTFALVFTDLAASGFLGVFIEYLEQEKLSIKDMKLMSANENFAKIHLTSNKKMMKIPRINPRPEEGLDYWVKYLSKGPVVVMILEGNQAIQQVCEAADDSPTFFEQWNVYGAERDVYCSDSEETVEEDIKLWFNEEHNTWSNDYLNTGLGFVFPDKEIGKQFIYHYGPPYSSYQEFLYKNRMTFLLIRPVAVNRGLVGQIITAFDNNSGCIRGMKIVTKEDFPVDDAWAVDGETVVGSDGDNSIGVAVVFHDIAHKRISWVNDDADHLRCTFDERSRVKISNNLVFKSKPGEMTTEHILKCFPFGFVIRPNLSVIELLEASMSGLCC